MDKVIKVRNLVITILLAVFFLTLGSNHVEGLMVIDEASSTRASAGMELAGVAAYTDMPTNYSKISENSLLELYLDQGSLGVKVRNKSTGYVWSSVLDDKDDKLNNIWQAFAGSAVSIEYLDGKGRTVQASMKAEKTSISIEKSDSGFRADILFQDQQIKLVLDVRLDGDSVTATIPSDSIEELSSDIKLQSVYIYPFFGASKEAEIPGYMFIPDGCGSLISLSKKTLATQPYVGTVYGEDLGITGVRAAMVEGNSYLLKPERVYMPVFGIVHGEHHNGFVATIKSGSEYTEIRAYPSGVVTGYNWVTAKISYRKMFFQPIDRKGAGMQVIQPSINEFDTVIKYMFLDGKDADYSGMARRYRRELVETGIINEVLVSPNQDSTTQDIPIRIEFVAAENKRVLWWKSIIPMTTTAQLKDILKDLTANNVRNISASVRGWTKGGMYGSSPKHLPFENKIGTRQEWAELAAELEAKGIPLYLYTDYINAYDKAKGYKKSDIAQAMSKQLISFVGNNLLNPNSTSRLFNNEVSQLSRYGFKYLLLDSIGSILVSAYNKGYEASRTKVVKIYNEMLSDYEGKVKFAIYVPNQFLWKASEEIYDIPMNSSGLLMEAESVPFIQIVLKGHIPYFAFASNFNADNTQAILKSIDYGSYPAFFLTAEDPVKLLDTGTQWLYTSQYSVWKDEILRTYQMINNGLKPVINAEFVSREKIADGVIRNTYSNGVSIIINYTKNAYRYENISIPAENFVVVGRE